MPRLGGWTASVLAGALVGSLLVVGTWGSLRLCDVVRGTSSCGRPGFVLLLAVLAVGVVAGRVLLTAFGVPDPGATSLLAVGLVVVVVMVFLVDDLFRWWTAVALPAVGVVGFVLAHWVTTTFVGPDPRDSMHR